MSFFQPNPNFLQLFADLDVSLEDGAWLLQKKKAFDDKQISRAREIRMNREERLKYFVRLETGESEEYAAAEALQDKYILFKGPGHISIGQIKAGTMFRSPILLPQIRNGNWHKVLQVPVTL